MKFIFIYTCFKALARLHLCYEDFLLMKKRFVKINPQKKSRYIILLKAKWKRD